MRAYLIDPVAKTVTEVEHDGSLESIYRHVQCDCVDAARFNRLGDVAYVDDEGLLSKPTDFFVVPGYAQPLAGRGLVVGTSEGDDVEPAVSLEELRDRVGFVNLYGGIAAVELPREPLARAFCERLVREATR